MLATTVSPLTVQLRATLALSEEADQALASLTHEHTQITAEAHNLRKERDDATKALHASKQQAQTWKQAVDEWTATADRWKAQADRRELVINQHVETISQLERESERWKEQCTSLQQTFKETVSQLRMDAEHWREQCRQLEQERHELASKHDALLAEHRARAYATPAKAASSRSSQPSSKASTTTRRTSAHVSTYDEDTEQPRSPTMVAYDIVWHPGEQRTYAKAPRPQASSASAAQSLQHSMQPGESRLIRRVHAVIEVPVKDEDDESASRGALRSQSGSHSAAESDADEPSQQPERGKKRPRRESARRVISYDDAYTNDDLDDPSDEDARVPSASRRLKRLTVEDDEDELMIGAKNDRQEIYGRQRVGESARPRKIRQTAGAGASGTARALSAGKKHPPGREPTTTKAGKPKKNR